MRKIFGYIILGLAVAGFIYIFIRTGSFITAITVAGIGLLWFLFNNIFELGSLFGKKSDKKINDRSYRNDKKNLEKKTENNPTLR